MKKEFVICYICIAILLVLCVMDIAFREWFNLLCNAIWTFTAYMVLKAGWRFARQRRELREQELFNKKLCGIIADLDKTMEAFDKVEQARLDAYKESLED